jgi:hypothetical protein
VDEDIDGNLVEVCANDLLTAFKLPPFFRWLAAIPAKRFARNLVHFDRLAGEQGIVPAGQFLVDAYSGGATWSGSETIPASGPVLIASNHPGMCDAMALWVAIGRSDLKVMAAERDLLKLLPHVSEKLIIVKPGTSDSIREASAHLRNGGALLTFPAGHIEPDPSLRTGSLRSFESWSASVDLLVRQVKGTILAPALVSGALSGKALASPFVRWMKTQKDRDWAGATLQILFPAYRRNRITVAFGSPVPQDSDSSLKAEMERLLRANPHLLE